MTSLFDERSMPVLRTYKDKYQALWTSVSLLKATDRPVYGTLRFSLAFLHAFFSDLFSYNPALAELQRHGPLEFEVVEEVETTFDEGVGFITYRRNHLDTFPFITSREVY